MEEAFRDFQYQPLIDLPPEVREISFTGVECRKGTFAEAEEVFRKLRNRIDESLSEQPFLRLHCRRMIESQLMMLAVVMKEPLSVCLHYLRRRLNLEYDRLGYYGKAGEAHSIANYAVDCGQREFAISLLAREYEQLNEIVEGCKSWMESTEHRMNQLRESGR
jgi:hypothetical protein